MTKFLFSFLITCTFLLATSSKYCPSIDIRNSVSNFLLLRNCSVIDGHLDIVLMENANLTQTDFEQYSFPELKEVTDYVIFFRVKKLTNLGKLFPNLSVIRGRNLFLNYALVVFEMENLSELGLYNLVQISRGTIRIEKNDNLCYINTVNWTSIISNSHLEITAENGKLCTGQTKCADACNNNNGYGCWNEKKCQKVPTIDYPNCLYGYEKKTGTCEVCANLYQKGQCVDQCARGMVLVKSLSKCVTKKECQTLDRDKFFVFNNECLNECPLNYEFVDGTCQLCNPRCHKVCSGTLLTNLDSILQLKECTKIEGNLSIKLDSDISDTIEEELEENLGYIEEITDFLKVHRSVAIKNFHFLKRLKVIRGRKLEQNRFSLWVHENPNLQNLFNTQQLSIENGTFSFHFNPKLCPSEIEHLAQTAHLKWNYSSLDVSNHSNGDSFACNQINIQVDVINLTTNSATLKWTSDQPETKFLIFFKEADDALREFSEEDDCGVPTWVTNFAFFTNEPEFTFNISDLQTFTNYSYFIRTNSRFGGRSEVKFFLTLSGDPSVPVNVQADSETYDSIKINWEKPEKLNGVLSHYVLFGYYLMEEKFFIDGRNYCQVKLIESVSSNLIETTTKINNINNNNCNCDEKQQQQQQIDIFTHDLEPFCSKDKHCKINFQYHVKRNTEDEDFLEFFPEANATSFVVTQLNHFTVYVFLLAACNVNRTRVQQCSEVVMTSHRTKKLQGADDITDFMVKQTHSATEVELFWSEPEKPNGMIVSYDIIWYNLERNDRNFSDCLTRLDHELAGYRYFFKGFSPGVYVVTVRANSMAGPGIFSPSKKFEITVTSNTFPVTITLITFVILLLLCVLLFVYWRQKIQPMSQMRQLIANVNPEYAEFKDDDKFLLTHDNVEVKEEIGKGTFGKVFNGFVHLKQESLVLPCAIKTLNDTATIHDQMEFINEAAVMKNFSDTHHVVKLIGVVTKPPLMVVMELMERGDLKNYLRKSREENSTSLGFAEICRMAIEIADGMAYLAAKKFVHRDLAARNCMVSRDRTVKIGDFGMTRDVYETDYYRKESRGLLPVRWMSPESLSDGVFTSDSDVWSYGVVLWEIITLAEQPYQGMSNEQVLQFVVSGGTLPRPKDCPSLIWRIMNSCFNWLPSKRPLFINIVEMLADQVGADFQLVSFYYSRAGAECRRLINEINTERLQHQPAVKLQRRFSNVLWQKEQDDEDCVRFYRDDDNIDTDDDID